MLIRELSQKESTDDFIELFTLDATAQGAGIYYITNASLDGEYPVFGGNEYITLPISAEGWEWNGAGKAPIPKVTIADKYQEFTALANQFNDLTGSAFVRQRTFVRYLDGMPDADETQVSAADIFIMDRISEWPPGAITWELTSPVEQMGVTLPRRKCWRDFCPFTYRQWNGTSFDYTHVTCQYTGDNYFDVNDNPTGPEGDVCSKRLRSCKLRIGTQRIIFGGMPGLQRPG